MKNPVENARAKAADTGLTAMWCGHVRGCEGLGAGITRQGAAVRDSGPEGAEGLSQLSLFRTPVRESFTDFHRALRLRVHDVRPDEAAATAGE